jgi:hypothetical protein
MAVTEHLITILQVVFIFLPARFGIRRLDFGLPVFDAINKACNLFFVLFWNPVFPNVHPRTGKEP